MDHEFNTLQKCGTWSLVPFHSSMNMVENRWVYQIDRMRMIPLIATKLVLLQRVFVNNPVWISLILLA